MSSGKAETRTGLIQDPIHERPAKRRRSRPNAGRGLRPRVRLNNGTTVIVHRADPDMPNAPDIRAARAYVTYEHYHSRQTRWQPPSASTTLRCDQRAEQRRITGRARLLAGRRTNPDHGATRRRSPRRGRS